MAVAEPPTQHAGREPVAERLAPDRPGERLRDRGIANAPPRGGRAVVRRIG